MKVRAGIDFALASIVQTAARADGPPAAAASTREFEVRDGRAFRDEEAVETAMQETARSLGRRKLRNVFVDLMHEYNHPQRITQEVFREPRGPEKKARLTAWFRAEAPEIEAGVCPTWNPAQKLQTADSYPGMGVRLIQKEAPIPAEGFVVNVETHRLDPYNRDGIFTPAQIATMRAVSASTGRPRTPRCSSTAATAWGSPTRAVRPRTPRWAATAPVPTTGASPSTMSGCDRMSAAGSTRATSRVRHRQAAREATLHTPPDRRQPGALLTVR